MVLWHYGIDGINGTSTNQIVCTPIIDTEAKTIQNRQNINGLCVNVGEPVSFAQIEPVQEVDTCDNEIDETKNLVQINQVVAGECRRIGEPIIMRKTPDGCTQQVR